MALQFTPGQLRSMVSIPPETYRHWRKTLAPLRRDRRQSPCFTSGDLIAVAAMRMLCVDLGIRVSAFTPIADALFEVCNASAWAVLERGRLIFDFPHEQLQFQPEPAHIPGEGTLVVLPLRPIVTQLRDQLLTTSESDGQQELRFPPLLASSLKPAATRGRP